MNIIDKAKIELSFLFVFIIFVFTITAFIGNTQSGSSAADLKSGEMQSTPTRQSESLPNLAPYDVASDVADDNGLPKNPKWGWQITHPGELPSPAACSGDPWNSPCTTQFTWMEKNSGNCPTGCTGHANWGTVTYEGIAFWAKEGHTCSVQDDDYNIDIVRSDQALLTSANDNVHNNQVGMHTEFNSDETVDNFHTKYWDDLHTSVDLGDCVLTPFNNGSWFWVPRLIDGDSAIVIGLLGLDCAHSAYAELHPVYAMALHQSILNTVNEDVWHFFVRNWGDEGYCASGGAIPMPLNKISFRLYRPWAADVSIISQEVEWGYENDQTGNALSQFSGTISPLEDIGAILTFTLPPPATRGFIDGTITLKWSLKMAPHPPRAEPLKVQVFPNTDSTSQMSDREERNAMNEFGAMTVGQRAVFERLINQSRPAIKYGRVKVKYVRSPLATNKKTTQTLFFPLAIKPFSDPIGIRRREQRIKAYQTALKRH
jgi:hypothetical protein